MREKIPRMQISEICKILTNAELSVRLESDESGTIIFIDTFNDAGVEVYIFVPPQDIQSCRMSKLGWHGTKLDPKNINSPRLNIFSKPYEDGTLDLGTEKLIHHQVQKLLSGIGLTTVEPPLDWQDTVTARMNAKRVLDRICIDLSEVPV
jgi:hypothetical protein